MHFGKDFWFIVKLIEIIWRILTELGKDDNEDTPDGEI